MKRAVVVSVLVAATAGLAALSRRPPRSPVLRLSAPVQGSSSRRASLCPPGTLPDQGVCIPVPQSRDMARLRASETLVPRRPDRPADYARYALPVAATGSARVVASDPTANGDAGTVREGISISATAAAPVLAPTLDGQEGPIRVVYVGTLIEKTAVTRHTARTGDRKSDYLVILGRLDATSPLTPKTDIPAGSPLGTVGASPLYLETRLLRPGVDPFTVPPERLLDDSVSVPVDPRNVLELRN